MCWFLCCFKQKTADEMRISDWSSDVCSSDLLRVASRRLAGPMKASSVEASAAKGWYDDLGNTNEWRSATHPSSPGLAGRAERGKRADLGEHKRGPPSATPEKKQIKQPQPKCMFGRIKGSTWATYSLQSCGRTEERRVGKECVSKWRSG